MFNVCLSLVGGLRLFLSTVSYSRLTLYLTHSRVFLNISSVYFEKHLNTQRKRAALKR